MMLNVFHFFLFDGSCSVYMFYVHDVDLLCNGFRGEQDSNPEAAVEFLAKYCQWAVVTLGANGCIAKHGKEVC